MSERAPQRIALRRSFTMRVATAVFTATASAAVYSCMSSWLGAGQAVPLTLAAFALLALCSVRHDRAQPVALTMGREGLTAWGRAGILLVQGRIAGCAHWSDRLLVLVLKPEEGCRQTLLIPADTVPPAVFRELAVRARRRAGA
ncbi:protein YgfX [Burkholderia sp. WSM2230]|uniref:protein YgfX n=1 Tax=Burkholderia sp. WSM2230 TaxID=944435 RepID=UPI002FBE7AD4